MHKDLIISHLEYLMNLVLLYLYRNTINVIKTIIMSIITVFVIIAFVRQESTGINIEEASIVSDNFSKVVDASVIEKNQSSIYKKGTYNSLYEITNEFPRLSVHNADQWYQENDCSLQTSWF